MGVPSRRRTLALRFACCSALPLLVAGSPSLAHAGPPKLLDHPLGEEPEQPEDAEQPEVAANEADSGTEAVREIIVEVPPDTASATTLTREELDAVPTRTAEDALRLAPGLVLVQHGAEGKGQQYFLRGFDAVHGLDFEVELDGVPLNEWSNIHAQGYLDLGLMIPELIGSVEVLPGPFVLDQGPFALAGSARFSLGVAEADRGLRTRVEFGSTLRSRALVSYSPREGDGGQFIAAEVMNDRGFGEGRDSRRLVVMARQPLVERDDHKVHALVIGHVASFGLPGTTSLAAYEEGRLGFWDAHDPGRGEARRAHVALDWTVIRKRWHMRTLAWSGYRQLELTENFTGLFERPVEGDRRTQRHAAVPFGLRLDHHAQLGRRVELRSGLGVRGDRLSQSEQRIDLRGRPFATTRELDATQADVWALTGVRWQAVETLELAAAVRVDGFVVETRDRSPSDPDQLLPEADPTPGGGFRVGVSPRAHLRWTAHPKFELFAAYGRGFRPPEARAFTPYEPEQLGPNEELIEDEGPRVSASDSGELGFRWRPDARVGLRLALFATHVGRESIFDHVSRTNLQLGATRRLGAEFGLDARPLPWLGLAGSVTWVDGRFVASGNPIPLAPTLVGSARAWVAHRLGARAGLMVVGWAPRPLPYGARGSGLARLDATFGWQLERVRVDVAIENLLGLRLREGEYYFPSNFNPGQPSSSLPALHYVPGPALNARLGLTVVF